ncbi:MAG: hypothetical protein ACI4L5_00130 [Negativibacillus sp.]
MKKTLILMLVFLLLLLCACSSAQNSEPHAPVSLETLGYTVNLELLPESMRHDVTVNNEDEVYILWSGSYTSLDMRVYNVLDAEPQTAMLLQAVPADTSKLQIDSEIMDIDEWKQYVVYENDDIIVFDVYPLAFDTTLSLPASIQQKKEAESTILTEKLDDLLSTVVSDPAEYRDISLGLSVTSETRYLEYLWEYCHDNIGELIKKVK